MYLGLFSFTFSSTVKVESASFSFLAFQQQVAVEPVQDLLGNGQAKTSASIFPGSIHISLCEALEDLAVLVASYADTCVHHNELHRYL